MEIIRKITARLKGSFKGKGHGTENGQQHGQFSTSKFNDERQRHRSQGKINSDAK